MGAAEAAPTVKQALRNPRDAVLRAWSDGRVGREVLLQRDEVVVAEGAVRAVVEHGEAVAPVARKLFTVTRYVVVGLIVVPFSLIDAGLTLFPTAADRLHSYVKPSETCRIVFAG